MSLTYFDDAEVQPMPFMFDSIRWEQMKQEIITIASMMAGKVVSASIDTTIQDTLVEETLREMGDSTWQN